LPVCTPSLEKYTKERRLLEQLFVSENSKSVHSNYCLFKRGSSN
jgi:hypothetical protein